MVRASDIVQALVARVPGRALVERTTGLPYGWALWMRSLPPLPARPHARAAEVEAVLVQRGVPAPVRGEELSGLHAFLALFRQGWLPPPRDERPARWASGFTSVLLHVLFVVLLAWIAYLQSLVPPPPPEAGGGGERIAVNFTGRGDPGTPDGGSTESDAPPGTQTTAQAATAQPAALPQALDGAESEPDADADAAQVSPPALPQVAVDVPAAIPTPALPEVTARQVPEPTIAPATEPTPAEQPVQVTEVAQPTLDYVLRPTTPREIQARPVAEAEVRPREVAVVVAPVLQAPRPREVDMPDLRVQRAPQLREREVDEPLDLTAVRSAEVRVPEVDAQLRRSADASVRQREVATPAPRPPSQAPVASPAPSTSASTASPTASSRPAPSAAPGPASPAPSAAPGTAAAAAGSAAPAASPGWDTALAGDDWGQADRGPQRPGGAPGLFDGQGRVRLPGEGSGPGQGPGQGPGSGPGEGVADRGAPGGENDTWSRERFEQSGTWLKRPPAGYDPTAFDRYWVPNESLLADWVRRGIKTVAIPIPGGNGKKINCVISLLQLGGGCGIRDDNLNEQPAIARPPPDIPFKPELQDDNGSVRPQQ